MFHPLTEGTRVTLPSLCLHSIVFLAILYRVDGALKL